MDPALDVAADDEKREGDRKRYRDNSPLPGTAGDANAGREPGTGRAGKSVNPKMMLRVDDDASAEKADAGEDTLNDAAAGIGNFRMIGDGSASTMTIAVASPTRPSVFKPIGLF
jgi:hypothetical protein